MGLLALGGNNGKFSLVLTRALGKVWNAEADHELDTKPPLSQAHWDQRAEGSTVGWILAFQICDSRDSWLRVGLMSFIPLVCSH